MRALSDSFDFDADSPYGDKPETGLTVRSRGVYGARVGIYRVLDFLQHYDLPATFFVPDTPPKSIATRPARSSAPDMSWPITALFTTVRQGSAGAGRRRRDAGARRRCAAAIHRRPAARLPLACLDLNPESPKSLAQAGFLYDSSPMDDERPYIIETGKGPLVELPIDWVLDDYTHFQFLAACDTGTVGAVQGARDLLDEFDGFYESGGCFILTMHPEVIGRHHRMKLLERFIQYVMRRRRRIFVATCLQVARHALDTVR